jgi:hypothetical protein
MLLFFFFVFVSFFGLASPDEAALRVQQAILDALNKANELAEQANELRAANNCRLQLIEGHVKPPFDSLWMFLLVFLPVPWVLHCLRNAWVNRANGHRVRGKASRTVSWDNFFAKFRENGDLFARNQVLTARNQELEKQLDDSKKACEQAKVQTPWEKAQVSGLKMQLDEAETKLRSQQQALAGPVLDVVDNDSRRR